MNKPHKHAELIKAWADGAEIEYLDCDNGWVLTGNPSWYITGQYRIHDPYRELKEAHAAGKVIQRYAPLEGWFSTNPSWTASPERYRIKPETKTVKIVLPKITDELWEDYNDTDLMSWDKENNRPNWTQLAVDFACVIKSDCNE